MWLGIESYPTAALEEVETPKTVLKSYDRKHTKEAVKQRGEVFTPTSLVDDMLDKLPVEVFTDKTKTFLDNSCGNGQFLYNVMIRKMRCMSKTPGRILKKAHKQALSTIYGVELDEKNCVECRERLLKGSTDPELIAIVNHNIICADALDPNHPGWSEVGFYWDKPEETSPVVNNKPSSDVVPEKKNSKPKGEDNYIVFTGHSFFGGESTIFW